MRQIQKGIKYKKAQIQKASNTRRHPIQEAIQESITKNT